MSAEPVPMKHDTPEKQAVAEQGTILRTQVGSGVHGIAIAGQDDRDEMGIAIEPPEYVLGLRRFEQYEWRSKPMHVRSGPGDLDLVIYGLRKWTRLALAGNPTVLLPLFTPDKDVVQITDAGRQLRAHPDMLLSRVAAPKFIGYLRSQRDRLLGLKSQRTNRPELVEVHGFDTKFAAHMVRLGVQGVELLETGRMTLPIPEPWRTYLRDLRQGQLTKDEALATAHEFEWRLAELATTSPLPERPDHAAVDRWLARTYEAHWEACRG